MKQVVVNMVFAYMMIMLMSNSWASSVVEAQKVIKETTDKMINALKTDRSNLKSDHKQLYALVDEIVLPHFDFIRMSKLVLAQNWKQATPKQQEDFSNEFRKLLVRTYATALIEAAEGDVKVIYKPIQAENEADRATINTLVQLTGKSPISIDYAMYFYNNQWKVYNVTVGGVSLVTNYRTEFSNDIQTIGMEGLIKKISKKKVEK